LACPQCGSAYSVEVFEAEGDSIVEGALHCRCAHAVPVIAGVPRVLPKTTASTLRAQYADFYHRHPQLARGDTETDAPTTSVRTLQAFGDEWRRFPELLEAHAAIFRWYFEGPGPVSWSCLRVLDAGCGMGRWLHFARAAGADVVGLDVSHAVDVAAAREGGDVTIVQADLRSPPFPPESFDLVYSLGVLHHLEDPLEGVRSLAKLVKPGGDLRFYVYRTLDGEPAWRRSVLAAVTAFRRLTTRLPYWAVHAIAWVVSAMATCVFIWPRRSLRRWPWGNRITEWLPLVQYADVPFRMVVSEQFDRLVAPIEGRFGRNDVEGWLRDVGFEVRAVLPGLGWRAVGRRPLRPLPDQQGDVKELRRNRGL
jgi:SAM-dependent methyltransferase